MEYKSLRLQLFAKGQKRYFGLECPQKHGGERYTSNNRCIKCHQEKKNKWKKRKTAEKRVIRQEARKVVLEQQKLLKEQKRLLYIQRQQEIICMDEERIRKREAERKYWAKPENAWRKKRKRANARAKKEKRMPKWLTKEDKKQIDEMYKLAVLQTELTGTVWEVDHIIPLNGKYVSGLHVPANLQVIPKVENRTKKNKYNVL